MMFFLHRRSCCFFNKIDIIYLFKKNTLCLLYLIFFIIIGKIGLGLKLFKY